MGGPSREAKNNEQAQTAFYNTMTAEQSKTFAEVQDIHDQIKAVTEPILKKGPNQYGFTPEEDALLRSTITDRGATAEANSITAAQLADKQRTGGTSVLPTGAAAEEEDVARVLSQQSIATNLSNEKLQGFSAGSQLYTQALNALSGQQQIVNPIGTANAAVGAGGAATSAINLADSERSTLLSSLLGGAIQGGLGVATGGASTVIQNAAKNFNG